jgi:hypothetical protein
MLDEYPGLQICAPQLPPAFHHIQNQSVDAELEISAVEHFLWSASL